MYWPTQFDSNYVQAASLTHYQPFASLISVDGTDHPFAAASGAWLADYPEPSCEWTS